MFRIRISMLFLLLTGCSASAPDIGTEISPLTPGLWRQSQLWSFELVDIHERSLGKIVLLMSDERVDVSSCDNRHWKKALVVEDELDFDFGFEIEPAYKIHGRWLNVDLTASICDADYNLNGELSKEGAAGFFNYSHLLGGRNIGTFTAVPVTDETAQQTGASNGK